MRFAHTQVWPMLRYFDTMAPSTAESRSASSNTMKGALPPSSSETFLTVFAHCFMSSLPTSVEPVKVNLRPRGFSGDPPADLTGRAGHTRQHALGDARPLGKLAQRERGV